MNIKRNAFPLVSDVATEETMLFNVHQKNPCQQLSIFLSFIPYFISFKTKYILYALTISQYALTEL